MPRIRSVKPDFFDDEKLAQVSRDARLTFIGMWVHSDDYGVVKGNHKWLKSKIFPYDEIQLKTFSFWISELEKINCILPFTADGESYYFIRTFKDHQKVEKPSKSRNPEPPDNILQTLPNYYPITTLPVVTLERKEGEGEGEGEGEIGRGKGVRTAHAVSPGNGHASSPVVFESQFLIVTQEFFDDLQKDFPALAPEQILNEIKKSNDWLTDNPTKRKRKANGHLKSPRLFIRNWLDKIEVAPGVYHPPIREQPPPPLDFDPVFPDSNCPICKGRGAHPDQESGKIVPCNCLKPKGTVNGEAAKNAGDI